MKPFISVLIIFILLLNKDLSAQFNLSLHCMEMDEYLGKSFHVRVIESESRQEVGRQVLSTIEDDTFTIKLFVLLSGIDYELDFYVDHNNNGHYDPPPSDHAWRRMVINPVDDVAITFIPDFDFINIAFPEWIKYRGAESSWGGKWTNQTLNTSDSIIASLKIICDSLSFSFSSAGIFGNPDTVSFMAKASYPIDFDPDSDTIHFMPVLPWTGEIQSINGELHGSISLMEMGLLFYGTSGLQQALTHYSITENGNQVAHGYFYIQELEVMYMFPPLEVEFLVTPISCHGGHDGEITAEVTGGTMNYTYNWYPIGTTFPTAYNLWADTFYVWIDDELNCPIEFMYIMDEPQSSIINVYITNESCPGACDAIIELTVAGEHPPYTYSIEGDSCTGFMTIFVTDAEGCVDSTNIFIGTDSDLVIFDIQITDATHGQSNGSAQAFAEGGIPPYQYSLDGVAYQASPLFDNLPSGSYCITILDGNSCMIKSDSFLIQNLTGVGAISSNTKMYPNPASSKLLIESDSYNAITLFDLDGQLLLQRPPSLKHEVNVISFPRGIYIVRHTTFSGITFQKLILD